MGYINPLLDLPAGQALQQLPQGDRARIEAVMRELRDQANVEAEKAWRKRKGPMAAYWRAVATYSRHIAHALSSRFRPAKACAAPTPHLRAQAEAAEGNGQHIYTNPRDSNKWRENEAWCRAASPAAVLALLDRIEALQAENERLRAGQAQAANG